MAGQPACHCYYRSNPGSCFIAGGKYGLRSQHVALVDREYI